MKILLVGNCQARPVAENLKLADSKIEISGTIIVHLVKNEDIEEHSKLFESADIILAQQVASSYPVKHVSTDYLKERYSEKVVTWVNVFFQGQNPDLFYVTDTSGKRLVGPSDVYHSKALCELWQSGVAAEDISAEDYISRVSSVDELAARAEKSLSDLKKREIGVDICMHDFIERRWTQEPLFHTFNHPNISTIAELCKRICNYINVNSNSIEEQTLTDRLALIVPPFEHSMATKLGLEYVSGSDIHGLELEQSFEAVVRGKKHVYEFEEYVSTAFNCYDAQKPNIEECRFTPS